MNELLAKFTNLSYEIFGVIIPGMILGLFIALSWFASSQVFPYITGGLIPEFPVNKILETIDMPNTGRSLVILSLLIVCAYFLGHILLWISRLGEEEQNANEKQNTIKILKVIKNFLHRARPYSLFEIKKPENNYKTELTPLYNIVHKKFFNNIEGINWPQFYPVVRSYITRNLSTSLVATYQNKYTLHRSLTVASALLFWLNFIVLALSLYSKYWAGGSSPIWMMVFFLLLSSLLLRRVFYGSYMDNWILFGNTIVTEAYSIIQEANNNDLHPKQIINEPHNNNNIPNPKDVVMDPNS